MRLYFWWCGIAAAGFAMAHMTAGAAETHGSHSPLRAAHAPSNRPLGKGPALFVDPVQGNDQQNGSQAKPWKTIAHALLQVAPGDTLYLRGGVYYENMHVALVARKESPLTVRAFPGEVAIVDGGLREFFSAPAAAWEPYGQGGPGEFRSTRRHPNLRNVVGAFGDSLIGLQSYYHAMDLRAANELIEQDAATSDIKPMYCGPGVWYDAESGRLHARLAHTNLAGFDNYRGETDPRKLPLVIAPFRSVPLHVDRAEHVRFQDLVIRGGGYNTVVVDQASHIEFDNVTVWCGTYGLLATGVQQFKFLHSALYGNVAPWSSRFESGMNSYPGRSTRDITRLNTHALLVAEGNREFSVYAYPFNNDWEIAHSEFCDAHDGLYLGGVNVQFHHNIVTDLHDDGIYLSPMYPRHFYLKGGATLQLYQNYFSHCLTMLALGGTENTQDKIYLYRNIFDLRAGVPTQRPAPQGGPAKAFTGQVTGDHGSPPWPELYSYHNTVVVRSAARAAEMNLLDGAVPERPRRAFNNIFVHGERLPPLASPDPARAQADANLYWQPGLDPNAASNYFKTYRSSPAFLASQKVYAPGFHAHSLAADPKFVKYEADGSAVNDYRLQPGSPAIDAGVELPAAWPDPLRQQDKGPPDIGALPLNAEPFRAGRVATTPEKRNSSR